MTDVFVLRTMVSYLSEFKVMETLFDMFEPVGQRLEKDHSQESQECEVNSSHHVRDCRVV